MLESSNVTAGQIGYGGAYNTIKDNIQQTNINSAVSIIESITQFAKKMIAAEGDISKLKAVMSEMTHKFAVMANATMQPPATSFFTPQAPQYS